MNNNNRKPTSRLITIVSVCLKTLWNRRITKFNWCQNIIVPKDKRAVRYHQTVTYELSLNIIVFLSRVFMIIIVFIQQRNSPSNTNVNFHLNPLTQNVIVMLALSFRNGTFKKTLVCSRHFLPRPRILQFYRDCGLTRASFSKEF